MTNARSVDEIMVAVRLITVIYASKWLLNMTPVLFSVVQHGMADLPLKQDPTYKLQYVSTKTCIL